MSVSIMVYTLGLGISLVASNARQESDGKALFVASRCNLCHSVNSAGVPSVAPAGGEMKIVDLSGLSKKRETEWLKAYLEKKEDLDGKRHPPRFKGEQSELDALVKWLMTLKPAD